MKSKCCNAEIADRLSYQYPNKTDNELRGRTNWFICEKCLKPVTNEEFNKLIGNDK